MAFETDRYVSNRVDRLKHLEEENKKLRALVEKARSLLDDAQFASDMGKAFYLGIDEWEEEAKNV